MNIKHISIQNFRGIKELNWNVNGDLICFIGSGDSTKSTILDVIEYTLSPRWNPPFEDSDFYNLDVDNDILINITIGQLPKTFLNVQKYGLYLRGWSLKDGLRDEPKNGDELVLTVSLQVGRSLEPKWLIHNDRITEERRISVNDRILLGMTRLGAYAARHLSWATGSILSGMTGEDIKINGILADAARKIRKEIDLHSFEDIVSTVDNAELLGKKMGVRLKNKLKARVDLKKLTIKESGVSLHDGNIPLRLSGIGTQRLMGLALQISLIKQGGINLIDEIEHGLEPHRISQILKLLCKSMDKKGQIFLTTHSPSVLEELNISNLKIVFSENGVTSIIDFKDDDNDSFQRLIRSNPSAFLAKRIIVCEGKTEQGILRGIDTKWQKDNKQGMWSYGVISVDGQGDRSFNITKQFNSMKYQVLWWGDSDVDTTVENKEDLRKLNIPVIEWKGKSNLEKRLFLDLPWDGVKKMIYIAVELRGDDAIVNQVRNIKSETSDNINQWKDSEEMRDVLGEAAHKNKWYKCISYAELIGGVVAEYLDKINNTDLAKKINILRSWIETGKCC